MLTKQILLQQNVKKKAIFFTSSIFLLFLGKWLSMIAFMYLITTVSENNYVAYQIIIIAYNNTNDI